MYLQNIAIINTAFSQPVEIKGKERRTLDEVNATFHSLSWMSVRWKPTEPSSQEKLSCRKKPHFVFLIFLLTDSIWKTHQIDLHYCETSKQYVLFNLVFLWQFCFHPIKQKKNKSDRVNIFHANVYIFVFRIWIDMKCLLKSSLANPHSWQLYKFCLILVALSQEHIKTFEFHGLCPNCELWNRQQLKVPNEPHH